MTRFLAWTVVFWLLLVTTAFAQQATVRLKNGGLVRGELVEVQPGQFARLHLSDGSMREIAWSEIARIDDADASSTGVAATLTAPPAANHPLVNHDEILRLESERASISQSGPVLMMIGGYAGFVVFTSVGTLMLVKVGDRCLIGCDLKAPGIIFVGLGIASAGLGIWGLVKLIDNSGRRNELDSRIERLTKEQQLALDLVPIPNGAALSMQLRF